MESRAAFQWANRFCVFPILSGRKENDKNIHMLLRYHIWKKRLFLLSEKEKQEVLTAIQSILATGYIDGKEILTKLSALFNVNTRNWLEVDFSRWGKCAFDNSKFEILKTAVIQCKEIKIVYENTKNERSTRIIQPLKLSYKSKEWYLKAFCMKQQDFRISN